MDGGNGRRVSNGKTPADFQVRRFHVDLTRRSVTGELAPCEGFEDVFGGISRGFKLLEGRAVEDASTRRPH